MLQLINNTPYQTMLLLTPDTQGVDTVWTIVRATYELRGNAALPAVEQIPVADSDVYSGAVGQSSITMPTDLYHAKPGTDVLLVGSAKAPGGRPTTEVDVRLAVGTVDKTIRVIGERRWTGRVRSASPSEPEPFDTMPLVWERAFGGVDVIDGKEPVISFEERNPVGTGFRVRNGRKELEGMKLPNLEDPSQRVRHPLDRPEPVCFGPVAPLWEPRRSFAGTYDAAWQRERAPYLPYDFDSRFFQAAPLDQVIEKHPEGGEVVELDGVDREGPRRFALPRERFLVNHRIDRAYFEEQAKLDTVLIDVDQNRLTLVFRAALRCDKRPLRVGEVEVVNTATTREGTR
jgi:hypothetical protein